MSREFWILTPPNGSDKRVYDKDPLWIGERNLLTHVRTVDPSYDAVMLELVEALETISNSYDQNKASNLAYSVLAKFEAWKKKGS